MSLALKDLIINYLSFHARMQCGTENFKYLELSINFLPLTLRLTAYKHQKRKLENNFGLKAIYLLSLFGAS